MPQDTLKRSPNTSKPPTRSSGWLLTPLPPVRVELVDAGQVPSPPASEAPDLLVESFCEV